MNKTKAVLEYLEKGNYITSWDAITLFKATRLSSIIFNLKKYGYNIQSIDQRTPDGTRYSRYWLEKENKDE